MKQIAIAVLLLGAAGTSSAVAADAWRVVEGLEGEVRGTWSVETGSQGALEGSAQMVDARGEDITYAFSGKRHNNAFELRRVDSSDRVDCLYEGELTASGEIRGVARCGAKSGPWIAEFVERADD